MERTNRLMEGNPLQVNQASATCNVRILALDIKVYHINIMHRHLADPLYHLFHLHPPVRRQRPGATETSPASR